MSDLLSSIPFVLISLFYIVTKPVDAIPLVAGAIYQRSVQHLLLKPIDSSDYYYKNIIGNIYYDTHSCSLFGCTAAVEFSKIKVADGKTFTPVRIKPKQITNVVGPESDYAKDVKNVYFQKQIVIGADPQSFYAVSYQIGKDKNRYYMADKSLTSFLQSATSSGLLFTSDPIDLIALEDPSYMIVKQKNKYFFTKPSAYPDLVVEISQSEAEKYPKLTQ